MIVLCETLRSLRLRVAFLHSSIRNHAVEKGSARVSLSAPFRRGLQPSIFTTRKGEDKVSATMCLARRQKPHAGGVCSPSNCIVQAKKLFLGIFRKQKGRPEGRPCKINLGAAISCRHLHRQRHPLRRRHHDYAHPRDHHGRAWLHTWCTAQA
jgi:hypothetical protein